MTAVSKFQKIFDQLDGLSQLGVKLPILMDSEFVKDLVLKFRTKLKSIDETLSSSKSFKKEQDLKTGVADIKNRMQSLNILLDQIETNLSQQSLLLNYNSRLKERLHKPFAEIKAEMQTFRQLEKTSGAIASSKILSQAKQSYTTARSHAVLQKAAKLKSEAEHIEQLISAMIIPLRRMTKALAINATGSIVVVAKECSSKDTNVVVRMWPQFLIQLLNCSLSEFLIRCGNKSTVEVFASSIVEQQNSLNAAEKILETAPQDSWLKTYATDLASVLAEFDIEIFAAYLSDWKIRVHSIDDTTGSVEFEGAYRSLSKARGDLIKAEEDHGKQLQVHEKATAKFADLQQRLVAVKSIAEMVILLCHFYIKIL